MSVTLYNTPRELARLVWAVNTAIYAGDGLVYARSDSEGADLAADYGLSVTRGPIIWAKTDINSYEALARLIADANRETWEARYGEDAPPTPKALGYDSPRRETRRVAWSILDRYRSNIYPKAKGGRLALAFLERLQYELASREMAVVDPFERGEVDDDV